MANDGNGGADSSGSGPLESSTSDFSRVAARYDATRTLPETSLAAAYARLVRAGALPATGRILDAGCGTGQASLPLCALGFEVLGIDISLGMTSLAQSKVRPEWRADYVVGDVRRIEAESGSFDAVVVSKLFQHVEDWRRACRELIRVVRAGHCVIQINERGAFGNDVRRHFSLQLDALGFKGRFPGLSPHRDGDGKLAAFMASQGCEAVPVDLSDLGWALETSYGEALRTIEEGHFAEYWSLPKEIFQTALAATRGWVDAQPEGAGAVQRLRPYLNVQVFRAPAAPRKDRAIP